jgi:hypothetical protein
MGKPTTDRAAIGHVIDGLTKAGWTLDYVNDGEDEVPTPTKAKALEAITAVDDAYLFVYEGHKNGPQGWVRFVLGNDPEEVVCDHTINLSAAIDPVTDPWWNE